MSKITDKINKYKLDAKTMLDMEKYDYTMHAIRSGLEYIVKQMCKSSRIGYDTRESNLDSMINELNRAGAITPTLYSTMQTTRRLSNAGMHVNLEDDEVVEITEQEARDAYDIFESLCEAAVSYDFISEFNEIAEKRNTPKTDPDFYNTRKRFYGAWRECYTREQLTANPDYVRLLNKAVYKEDIEAMINIAIGFLYNDIFWKNDIIYNCKRNGRKEDRKTCWTDYRYYYWILRAMYFTSQHYRNGDNIPKQYITTALWDAYTYLEETVLEETLAFENIHFKNVNGGHIRQAYSHEKGKMARNQKAVDLFSIDDRSFDLKKFYKNLI
jgi:hypothetical protein